MVGMEGGSLEVHLPPQHPQHLLLQHGLHLHPSLQLVQALGVLAHVEALDLLVDALQLVQGGPSGDGPGGGAARGGAGHQAVALHVEPQAAQVDVVAVAVWALVRTLAGVQALVQLEMDKLGELGRAQLALVRLLARMEAQVGLQVAGAAEALVTHLEDEGERRSCYWLLALALYPKTLDGIIWFRISIVYFGLLIAEYL